MKLGTIEEEAARCRKAFEGVEVGALVWHCHHDRLIEVLSEPAENRIEYILTYKPEDERALRLRLFRPVRHKFRSWVKIHAAWLKAHAKLRRADAALWEEYAEWEKAVAEWEEADREEIAIAHAEECPDCPWDGKTIFPPTATTTSLATLIMNVIE